MLKKIQKTIFFAIIFLLPLVFNKWGFDMYELPKNTFLKIGVGILCIALLLPLFKAKKIAINLSKTQIYAICFFLLVLAMSLIVAIRPNVSFWGSYSRQGGIINMLFYLLLFLASLKILSKKENIIILFKGISAVGVIMSVYAILQKLGYDIFPEEITALFAGRSFSTMGNPTSFGAFLLFPIWSEMYLLNVNKKRRIASFSMLILLVIALVLTANRASMLALIGTGFLYMLRQFKGNKKALIGILTGTAVLGVLFVGIYGDNLRSFNSRISTWKSSFEIIADNPIAGYGLESFPYVFERYVREDFFDYEDYKNLADRPHNEFIESWIHLGLLGALMYLGFVFFCFKKYWLSENKEVVFASLAVLSLIASNIFSFSLVTHYSFLAVFVAIILLDRKMKLIVKNSLLKKTIIGFAILLIIASMTITVRTFLSDFYITKAYLAYNAGENEMSVNEMEKATNSMPFYSEIYSSASTLYCYIASATQDASYLLLAADANQKAIEISAGSLQSLLDEARIYILAGDYESAQEIYLSAYENIGFNPFLYEKWGNAYFAEGKYAEAAIVYDELLEVMPEDWAAPLLSGSEPSEGERIFWKVHSDFLDTLQNAIDSYAATGQDAKAEEIMDKLK
ncbi:MAG: hypothetical protein ACD_51C00205G0005 [uncultured bacterium]|nr:MAG: hypothetical protein ACD_51C00205G0005 [uncultured bacterium]OGJ48100.1 MAG: hypothetical protein A2244_01260 [Candidatus Peregrinibacteria bacterium RIFOXYA2_FULL_41_18]OGJ49003.1 MAG: hypothetical protein A2344_00505 [Candidatus Peregrinibacteria bacterium RIFOXYB12_FULL_41_12]